MNNLLRLANTLIPPKTVSYSKWEGSEVNNNMLDIDEYAKAINIKVNLNPVNTSLIKKLGLDYKKNYFKVKSIPSISGLSRMNNGDQFTFDGKKYQIETPTGWHSIAGWDTFLSIEMPQ